MLTVVTPNTCLHQNQYGLFSIKIDLVLRPRTDRSTHLHQVKKRALKSSRQYSLDFGIHASFVYQPAVSLLRRILRSSHRLQAANLSTTKRISVLK